MCVYIYLERERELEKEYAAVKQEWAERMLEAHHKVRPHCMCTVCIYVCVYIYIYIYRERERAGKGICGG